MGVKLLICMAFCGYLLLFPARAADAARAAMALWARSVAPALFPFMTLIPVIAGEEAQRLYSRFFGGFMQKSFHLPGSAASAVTVGIIAGTPAGALTVRRAYDAGALDEEQALIAGILSSGCGPVFLVCSIGGRMFQNPAVGVKILLCADAALLVIGALFSRFSLRGALLTEPVRARNGGEDAAVFGAVKSALGVCGWMMLFGVLASAFPGGVRWVFEVSAGCNFAAQKQVPLLAAFVCGMGGACSLCQNIGALKTAGRGTCALVSAKLACGALSAGLYWVLDLAAPKRNAWFSVVWARRLANPFIIASIAALVTALCICVLTSILLQKRRTGLDDETSSKGIGSDAGEHLETVDSLRHPHVHR